MTKSLVDLETLESLRELNSPEDPHFTRRYFEALLEPIPTKLDRIQKAITEKDSKTITLEAHAIKSSCLNAGIFEVVKVSAELESIGKKGSLQNTQVLLDQLKELCEELHKEVYSLPEFTDSTS